MSESYRSVVGAHPDRIPPLFDRWVREHGIEDDVAPLLYTVTTWVKHCSPAEATPDQRALACMDLAISFFYLDDYAGEDYHALFDQYEATLAGRPPPAARGAVAAHADLFAKLGALGHPMDAYIAEERRLLAEYRLRNDVRRGLAHLTYARHREARLVTIYVYQWLELWQLIGHEEGLAFVYTGNVPGDEGEHTFCPNCANNVIRRHGFRIVATNLKRDRCGACGHPIPLRLDREDARHSRPTGEESS